MRTSRLATVSAAYALLWAHAAVGVDDDGSQSEGGSMRRSAAAATSTVADSDGLVTLPLLPHHEVVNRRRRERRQLGEQQSGGRQEILAMYQGYGTHYADLWVGTPPQRQTVIVDTGSGLTAFPCSLCHDCGADKYHTDSAFVEADSRTFQPVHCDKCSLGPCGSLGHGGLDEFCLVSMRYEEGSMWKAYEGKDWVYPGGPHDVPLEDDGKLDEFEAAAADGADPALSESFRFPLRFGCQTTVTGLFKTQLADGIMGMENAQTSIWAQMHANGITNKRAFSLCYVRQNHADKMGTAAGALTLGGTDERLHQTPMVWAEQNSGHNGWYQVQVRAVYIRASGGNSAAIEDSSKITNVNIDQKLMNAGGIIVDSGTTDTYLKRSIRSSFQAAWKTATGKDMPTGGAKIRLNSSDEMNALPTILFQLRVASHLDADDAQTKNEPVPGMAAPVDPSNPRDVLIAMPASHYLTQVSEEGDFKMRLHFSEKDDSGGVLGANAMLGHDVAFDLDNGRIGWAESDCNYEGVNGEEADAS